MIKWFTAVWVYSEISCWLEFGGDLGFGGGGGETGLRGWFGLVSW